MIIMIMLRRFISITVLFAFVVLFTDTVAVAQDSGAQQRRERRIRQQKEAQTRLDGMFKGQMPEGTATVFGRAMIGSVSEGGFGNTIMLLEAGKHKVLSDELGMSADQFARMQFARDEIRAAVLMNSPKYVSRFKKMTEADHESLQNDLRADFKRISDHMDGITTPEQKEKTRKLMFQTLGGLDSPFMNADAVQTLNLSDEQKEKAAKTFEEMKAERVAQMEEGLKLIEKAVKLGGANMSDEDRERIEAEGKALEARIMATGKKLGEKLRGHLTDEQRELEKTLLASRPKFLPPLPSSMRGDFTGASAVGLDSWAPGQGAPDDGKEKRRRRPFPMTEDE